MKWLVAGIVTFALVLSGLYLLFRQEAATSVNEAGQTVLHFGALAIPVTDAEPLPGRPPIFKGLEVHPAPEFDTTALGDDLTLTVREADRSEIDALEADQDLFGLFARVVYVGHDIEDSAVYLFQPTGPSLFDALRARFTDYETTGIFGSTYGCCRSQANEGTAALVNLAVSGNHAEYTTYDIVEMWAIQDNVSAIAFTDSEGNPLGWQRPVSGYVGARFPSDSGTRSLWKYRMIAYDASGTEVEEASTWYPGKSP